MIDYSCDDSGTIHRIVIISGKCTFQIDYSGDFQTLYDTYKRLFNHLPELYIPEDCRGQSAKYNDFLNLRLS